MRRKLYVAVGCLLAQPLAGGCGRPSSRVNAEIPTMPLTWVLSTIPTELCLENHLAVSITAVRVSFGTSDGRVLGPTFRSFDIIANGKECISVGTDVSNLAQAIAEQMPVGSPSLDKRIVAVAKLKEGTIVEQHPSNT
jgi:hypothetical protein